VLILQGALDRQITSGQADTLAAAIREGGNRDVTVQVRRCACPAVSR